MQVFEHGQMRLYLLSLLAQGPRHGYDIIKALENRFEGLYSPSAGTVYPRLAKLEEEGLVERTDEGRKASYRITEPGRAEVARRIDEIAELNASLDASAQRLAQDVRYRVRTGAADLRTQLAAAAQAARKSAAEPPPSESQPSGSRRDANDVWARVTDSVSDAFGGQRSGAHPLGDVEGLLRAFGGGTFPDADMVTQALRRMGMMRTTGQSSTATDSPEAKVESKVETKVDQPDGAPDPDAEVIEAEVIEEPHLQEDPQGGGPRRDGFATPGQVREIVEILKDAGTRIQAVLKEPRA